MKYHQRITWLDGVPHLQRCPIEVRYLNDYYSRPGTFQRDGEIVRPATEQDMADMNAGRLAHDPATEPGRLA